jgi:hypothetical protein
MVVGVVSPLRTVRTLKWGSSICGPVPWAATMLVEVELISRERITNNVPTRTQIAFLAISIYSFQEWKTTQPGDYQSNVEPLRWIEVETEMRRDGRHEPG